MANTPTKRLISLDAFRGFTIIGMIIVNTPGSWEYVFPPLRHAAWNGLTPTDLVFPFFLFIVGVSIVLAYTKRLKNNAPKGELVKKILKRSFLIFAFGIALNLIGADFAHFRIPGVLQRIAIVFLVCSLLFLFTSLRTQIWVGIISLVGYYLLMMLVWVPDVGAGVLEPGKNLAAWVDSMTIPFYMYQGTWDPEGILSTLPAIGTGITGMLAGHIVVSEKKIEDKVILLFVTGFFAVMIGEMWGWIFPINKNIWTSSYVLYTSGLASMTWAVLIWIMDMKGYKKWAEFGVVFGTNAITAYVLSYILLIPFTRIPVRYGENIQTIYMKGMINTGMMPEMASFTWALFATILCFIPVLILYRKKIFLKI
jgi:predicted acyltransferase